MGSNKNSPHTSVISTADKYEKRQGQGLFPESIVVMTRNPIPSTSITQLSEKQHKLRPREIHRDISIPQGVPFQEMKIFGIGYRLLARKILLIRLTLVCDIMNALSIMGIVLMVIANELQFHNSNDDYATWFIKLVITISTIFLLGLIFWYHYLDLKLRSNHNSHEHWYVGLTARKLCLIAIEVVICAMHPMPRTHPHVPSETEDLNSTMSYSYTSIDVGLGLAMFLRLYLLGRSIVFHSDLIHNASLRSFGCLNQVSINIFFLMKTHLDRWPTRCLLIICTISFFIGSWSLRACDYTSPGVHQSMSDSMWLFVITFTTVGYGDIKPSSYCGRSVAAIIGLFGVIMTSTLIAVISQKLLLSREEKYLNTFVMNSYLNKKHHYEAANVVKCAIKVWYFNHRNKYHSVKCLLARRRLRQTIDSFRQTKLKERTLIDSCVTMKDLLTEQRNTSVQLNLIVEEMITMKAEKKTTDEELINLKRSMDTLQTTMNMLLDTMTKHAQHCSTETNFF